MHHDGGSGMLGLVRSALAGVFDHERNRIGTAAGPWTGAVGNVGSTSVPGLDAKPVVDIMVGLHSLREAGRCIQPLENFGCSLLADRLLGAPPVVG